MSICHRQDTIDDFLGSENNDEREFEQAEFYQGGRHFFGWDDDGGKDLGAIAG